MKDRPSKSFNISNMNPSLFLIMNISVGSGRDYEMFHG